MMNITNELTSKKTILIDTILYNPMCYLYNLDTEKLTVTMYNDFTKEVTQEKVKRNKLCMYVKDSLKNKWYIDYMFEISEKRWN